MGLHHPSHGVVVTAPDPGLSDLIAAHTLRVVELNEAARYPECNGCDWVGGLVKDHAVHLASVVEQHANGRMAELEAERDQAVAHDRQPYPTAWAYEQACAALEKHRKRADKHEATVARVEKLAHDMRGWCSPHGISVTYSDRICAALEGES